MCKWQIKIGMTGNFRYIGINLSGLIQEVVLSGKIHFVCIQKNMSER